MPFTAYHRDEYLFAHESLDAVLAHLANCDQPAPGDDAAIFWAGRVVAVRDCHGTVTKFGQSLPTGAPVVRLIFQHRAPRKEKLS